MNKNKHKNKVHELSKNSTKKKIFYYRSMTFAITSMDLQTIYLTKDIRISL